MAELLRAPFDEVVSPVAGHGAGSHVCGAFGNRGHIGNLASSGPPAPEVGAPCTPDTAPHRWSLPIGVSPCRQGFARLRHRAIFSGEQPWARWVLTYYHGQGHEHTRPPWVTHPGRRQRLFHAGTIGLAPRRVAG